MAREPYNLFEVWLEIPFTYGVSGKAVWDARLAAVMEVNRTEYLVTFDTADFGRFPLVKPVLPQNL